MKRILLLIMLMCFSSQVFAWSAQGHRVMAQIAEKHLTPMAKKQIDDLLQVPINGYPMYGRNFIAASIWADQVRQNARIPASKKFSAWHFIDLPFSENSGSVLSKARSENLMQALKQTREILRNPAASSVQKAFALRFFIHLVADAHQPLHCATRITNALPNGDKGGNDFPIASPDAENLHQLWDGGVGLFQRQRHLAAQIEKKYPIENYKDLLKDQNMANWLEDCHKMAVSMAYTIKEGAAPSAAYIQKGQQVTEEQLAIAGYRLAYQLNELLGS